MKQPLVFSQEGNLCLDTSMTQGAFSKARFAERLSERGVIAQYHASGWTFSRWSFTGSAVRGEGKDSTIVVKGQLFSGLTLKTFLEDKDNAKRVFAGARVCSAMEDSMEQGQSLPRVGAGGIFISADFEQILFLPQAIFKTAMLCAGPAVYSEQHGMYINENLTGDASVGFTQAVIAYKLLSGDLPFAETDSEKREEDYRDSNYIPIVQKIWALDDELAYCIDNSLKRQPSLKKGSNTDEKVARIVKEQRETTKDARRAGMKFPVGKLYRETGLTSDGEIPSDGTLQNVIRKSSVSQEHFEADSKKKLEHFAKTLNRKRWLRNHRTGLTVVASAFAGVFIFAVILVQGSMSHPTSKGLSEYETAEMFYSALNTMDVSAADACSSGKKASNMIDSMSAYFVTMKQRSAMDFKFKSVSPGEWFNFNYDGSYSMYGISQFYIGFSKKDVYFSAPLKKDFPKPVTTSGGLPLKEGDKKTVTVTYFFLYNITTNTTDDTLSAVWREDTLTLTYRNKRWIITDVAQENKETFEVPYAEFLKDYQDAMEVSGGNAADPSTALAAKYPFVPLGSEVIEAANRTKELE